MNRPEDVVDAALIDQQPRVLRLGEHRRDFLRRGPDRERRQIDAVDENVLCFLFGELDRIFQQFSLVLVDAPSC